MSNLAGIPSASVLCLRNMIAEIDAMKSLPTAKETQEMIARWQVVELHLHKTEDQGKRAAALINEHEIQVLLKTRKFRDAQEERRHRQRARQGWLARDYEEQSKNPKS